MVSHNGWALLYTLLSTSLIPYYSRFQILLCNGSLFSTLCFPMSAQGHSSKTCMIIHWLDRSWAEIASGHIYSAVTLARLHLLCSKKGMPVQFHVLRRGIFMRDHAGLK